MRDRQTEYELMTPEEKRQFWAFLGLAVGFMVALLAVMIYTSP